MVDKKALLLAALAGNSRQAAMHERNLELVAIENADRHPADLNAEAIQLREVAENRFATFVKRGTKSGEIEEVDTAEYCVWTDEEALSFDYNPAKGAIATSNKLYKVYRVI
jgi:hypothetical protein